MILKRLKIGAFYIYQEIPGPFPARGEIYLRELRLELRRTVTLRLRVRRLVFRVVAMLLTPFRHSGDRAAGVSHPVSPVVRRRLAANS